MTKDMTAGKPLRLILAFFFPMLMGNLFQQFYNMADTIIVGQFVGVKALAAVGSTGSLNFLVIGFVLGICSGFSIPIAQYFGAGDHRNMRHCLANAAYLAAGITVVLTTVVMLTTRQILELLQTPDDIFSDAYSYIIIIFAGIFAIMFYNLLACVSRALGDSRTPLYFLIIASVLNVALDLIFIIIFNLGAAGAAYATVISQMVSGLLCFFYMRKKFTILHMNRDELRLDPRMMSHLLFMGLPMGLQFSITAVGGLIVQAAVNSFGSGVVAAVTAANKVQLIVTQPMETMGITMATYCGQNLGARKIARVETGVRQSLILSVCYCVFACIAMFLAGNFLSQLFISGSETQILAQVSQYLRTCSLFFPLLGILFILRNSLQGLGYALPAMAAGVFELVARTLVAFCLVGAFQFNAICFSNPVAWVFADILLVPVFIAKLKELHCLHPPEAQSSL